MEVIFGNQTIPLKGTPVKLGDQAPNFKVLNTNLQLVTLEDFSTDYLVISVVPSLDTGVCDYQTKTFNEKLSKMKKVSVLTISNDLPFAQKRWCANANMENIVTLSDYVHLDFAMHYGTLIEPLRLQTRAVFVLDKERKIIYREYLPNVSEHPSYEEVEQLLNERLM